MEIKMVFGKRSIFNKASEPTDHKCIRCSGTGRIRERGSSIVYKACAGTGKSFTDERLCNGILARSRH
jgi:DnaJ-class molecular chaperone